jgi:hypothetical protein
MKKKKLFFFTLEELFNITIISTYYFNILVLLLRRVRGRERNTRGLSFNLRAKKGCVTSNQRVLSRPNK